jgi:hypothetical protein
MALNSYLFSVGDSNEGPVGLCLRVKAASAGEAVKLARGAVLAVMDDCDGVRLDQPSGMSLGVPSDIDLAKYGAYMKLEGTPGGARKSIPFQDVVEYIRVYFNPDKITAADIEDQEEVDE